MKNINDGIDLDDDSVPDWSNDDSFIGRIYASLSLKTYVWACMWMFIFCECNINDSFQLLGYWTVSPLWFITPDSKVHVAHITVGTLGNVTYVTLHTTWRTPKRVRNNYDHWGIMLHVRGYVLRKLRGTIIDIILPPRVLFYRRKFYFHCRIEKPLIKAILVQLELNSRW